MIAKTVKFGAKSHCEVAAFSPDGQYCVSGSVDGFVEVWDYQTATLRKDLPYQEQGSFMMHGEGITFCTWSKDSSQILTASFDQTARAHGVKSGKTLKEFRGHTSYVNTAVYSKDGSKVITASSDGKVMIFDARTTEMINTLVPPPPAHRTSTIEYSVNSALILPSTGVDEEPLIFVCTRTNTVVLMNLQGQVIKSFSSGKREEGDFVAMTPSPKGEWLYAVAEDHKMYCFSVTSGGLEQTIKVAEGEVIGMTHHPSRNVVAAFSTDGTMAILRP